MVNNPLPIAIIYTDGSCNNVTTKIGGYGAVIETDKGIKELNGHNAYTTSNRMELQAAIAALESLTTRHSVILYSDSTYVIKGMKQWLKQWKLKNYQGVKNTDLWQQLDSVSQRHKIKWQWIKGHSGIQGNERADKLASLGAQNIIL